jgi:hypothetical protein
MKVKMIGNKQNEIRYNNLSVRLVMRSLHIKHNKKVRMSANKKVADIAKRMLI